MSVNIDSKSFLTLLKGEFPTEGAGASYDIPRLRRIALAQVQPFTTKQAAATIKAPTSRVGSILNKWEKAGLLVKTNAAGNASLWFPRDKVPKDILKIYDARKDEQMEAIALSMPEE